MAAIHDFIKQRKELIWYVKDYDALDERSIVEATLNYGDWDDVQELIRILGMERTAEVFREYSSHKRCNYTKEAKHYFTLYFDKHAPRKEDDQIKADELFEDEILLPKHLNNLLTKQDLSEFKEVLDNKFASKEDIGQIKITLDFIVQKLIVNGNI